MTQPWTCVSTCVFENTCKPVLHAVLHVVLSCCVVPPQHTCGLPPKRPTTTMTPSAGPMGASRMLSAPGASLRRRSRVARAASSRTAASRQSLCPAPTLRAVQLVKASAVCASLRLRLSALDQDRALPSPYSQHWSSVFLCYCVLSSAWHRRFRCECRFYSAVFVY